MDEDMKQQVEEQDGDDKQEEEEEQEEQQERGVLELFWMIAELDAQAREQGTQMLLNRLGLIGSGTNAKVAESEDVKYTVRRLMRGLASGRDAARQGYATSLCEILKLLPEFSVESFLDILATEVACQRGAGREVEKCEKGGIVSASSEFVAVRIMTRFFFSLLLVHHSSEKMAKQELRDNSIGRVFAFGVLARVLDQTRNEKRSLELTKETATQAATELFKIYHEKSYLRELVTEVVILMFKEIGPDVFQASICQCEDFRRLISASPVEWHPETLWLYISFWKRLPEDLKLNKTESGSVICEHMSPESLSVLVEPMKNSISCHPRIHSVWAALIDFTTSQTSMSSPVLRIWLEIIDKFLLTSTHIRKYLALSLLPEIVTHVDEAEMQCVFTPNLMKCLVHGLKTENEYLTKICTLTLQKLLDFFEKMKWKSTRLSLLVSFQRAAGGTLTKMLENPQVKRLQSLSMDAIKNYVSMLVEAFCCYPFEKDLAKVLSYPSPVVSKKARKRGEKPPKEEEDMEDSSHNQIEEIERRQLWALEQLYALLRIHDIPEAEKKELRQSLSKFFLLQAAFKYNKPSLSKELHDEVKNWIARTPSSKVRTACCNRIMGILPNLCLEDKRPIQSSTTDEEDSERGKPGVKIKKSLEDLLDFMLYLEKSKSFSHVVGFEKEEKLARNELRALISKINDEVSSSESERASSRGLVIQKMLQNILVYHLLEPEKLGDVLKDLILFVSLHMGIKCSDRFIDDQVNNESINHMDVFVDIILALLARTSSHLRTIVYEAFGAFSSEVTEVGIDDILSVIEGHAADNEKNDSIDNEEEEEEEEEEEREGDDDDDNDGDDDDDDGDDDDNDSDNGTRNHQENGPGTDGANQKDDSDSDSVNADDEEMFRMDDKLSSILKAAKTDRQEDRDKRDAVVHFKFRVLGLVETLIIRNPMSQYIPQVLQRLLEQLRVSLNADNKQLSTKIMSLYKKLPLKKIAKPSGDFVAPELDSVRDLIVTSARHSQQSTKAELVNAALSAFEFGVEIFRVCYAGVEDSGIKRAVDALIQGCFLKRTSKINPKMIQDLLQKFPDVLFPHARQQLAQEASGGRNIFLKISALKALSVGLKHLSDTQAATELTCDGFIEKVVPAILGILQGSVKMKSKQTLEALQTAHDFMQKVVQNVTSIKVSHDFIAFLREKFIPHCSEMARSLSSSAKKASLMTQLEQAAAKLLEICTPAAKSSSSPKDKKRRKAIHKVSQDKKIRTDQ